MYQTHFRLNDRPFRLTPDLDYRYGEASQQQALETLLVALDQGESFVKVVGEVGLGKTLLCRTLIERLPAPFVTAWLPDPAMTPGELRAALLRDLGLDCPETPSLNELQQQLLALARRGLQPVVVIDEAQTLPDETLEAVRLLTNLETEKRKLLQVVLFAQPELDQRLAAPAFRQLRQRITFSCRLSPLNPPQIRTYVTHRLRAAGAERPLFTTAALRSLTRSSQGIPRLINILCDKALLAAYGRGKTRAGWREMRRAIADTESLHHPLFLERGEHPGRAVSLATLMLLALGLGSTLWWLYGGST